MLNNEISINKNEIEKILLKNSKIQKCSIFSIPDQSRGDELCAWIKLKPNEKMTSEEFKKFCIKEIPLNQIPKYVKFVDKFPTNKNGKVQKFRLQEKMISDLHQLKTIY
jgi:fatty-acyl-CoA synthase